MRRSTSSCMDVVLASPSRSLPSRPVPAARRARPRMSAAELFGLVVSWPLVRLPGLRAAARGAALMTVSGWLADRALRRRPDGADAAARRLHGAGLPRRARLPHAVLGPVERLFYRAARRRPGREQDWKALRAHGARLQRRSSGSLLYLILRTQGDPPVQPARASTSAPWDVSSTPTSSFVTNTNWQFYGGETTLSYFSPDGRPGGAELRLGRGRHGGAGRGHPRLRSRARRRSSATSGSDLTRSLLYVLLPLSVVGALFLVSQGVDPDARRLPRRHDARRRRRRRSRSARPPRRRRSSSSAPTAAASSTSTRRCRSRTRPRSRTSSSCC